MLHIWLIPLLILALLAIGGFYLVVRAKGGTGVRSPGRTLVDKPDDSPPGE